MSMPKPAKIFFYITALVIGLLATGLVALAYLVDPNDYRDDIQNWVRERTGHALTIDGDLHLSLFPRLSLEINHAALANAPGFGQAPLVQLGGARIMVRLLPLLQGKLQVTRLTLQGLEVNLVVDEQGRANWAMDGTPPSTARPAPANGPKEAPGAALAALTVSGIQLEDASLHWRDRGTGQSYTLDGLMLETGPIRVGSPVDIRSRFSIAGSQPELSGRVNLGARLRLSSDLRTLQAERLRLESSLLGPDLPHQEVRINLETHLSADLAKEMLRLDKLVFTMDDETTLRGHLHLAGFTHPALRFDARIDRLDLDALLPSTQAGGGATATPAEAAAGGTLALPMELLRSLDLEGKLGIGTLQASGLHISRLATTIVARNGLIHIKPLTADLYEGHYRGEIELDARGSSPAFKLHERLEGVQTGPLLKDYLGSDPLVSRANVEAALQGHGRTDEELLRNTRGTVSLSFRDGAIKGINLARLIREVRAAVKGEPLPGNAQPKATDFTELHATLMIADGRAHNDDLALDSPFLRVRGKGMLDLLRQRLDYRLQARFVASDTGQGGKDISELKGLDIPLRIAGSFAAPRIEVDRDFIAKALAHKVKKKARKKLKKELERQLRKHEDEIEPQLQQQLKDTLRQLF